MIGQRHPRRAFADIEPQIVGFILIRTFLADSSGPAYRNVKAIP